MATYTIGDYLLDRLAEIGITELFGVPGDFNLKFLDRVVAHSSIRWVGNSNELNAGYAADAYARLRGVGAFLTTFGVGELSAANAMAGSYAENVPVIHIVGSPRKELQASVAKIHHSMGDGDFARFFRVDRELTCVAEDLNAMTAPAQIDHLIVQVLFQRKPGVVHLAADVAQTPCEPPTSPLPLIQQHDSAAAAADFERDLREFITDRHVAVLADVLVHRFGAQEAVQGMLDRTGAPVATLSWGKTVINEETSNFAGIYSGAASHESTRTVVEDATALISLGVDFTDNITAGFSVNISQDNQVDVRRDTTYIKGFAYTPLSMGKAIEIIEKVITEVEPAFMPVGESNPTDECQIVEGPLSQASMWALITRALEPGNIVLAEQGTSFFGLASHHFPTDTVFIGQPMWGSIGYTLPATLGAGLAERDRRPVLLIGDGSAQLTIQEIGQLVREKVPAVIFLINNDGYTVERAINGEDEYYNDIPAWNWSKALDLFGAGDFGLTLRATTTQELTEALEVAAAHKDKLVFIEAVTPYNDYPEPLKRVAEALKSKNAAR